MRNMSHGLLSLDSWAPGGGAVWGGYGTCRGCSLTGGSMSLEFYSLTLLPVRDLCFLDVNETVINQLPTPATIP